jgi:hypothetical protein
LRELGDVIDDSGSAEVHVGNVSLSEVEGEGHWWWNTLSTNDGGALFDSKMRKFLQQQIAASALPPLVGAAAAAAGDSCTALETSLPGLPQHFRVVSLNPSMYGSKGGIRILQLERPYMTGTVDARWRRAEGQQQQGHWVLTTANVRRFAIVAPLRPPAERRPLLSSTSGSSCGGGVGVEINGASFTAAVVNDATGVEESGAWVGKSFLLGGGGGGGSGGSWAIDGSGSTTGSFERHERGPSNYGPARQVFASEFVIVRGTGGSVAETDANMRTAVLIANSHYLASHTRAVIMTDDQLHEQLAASPSSRLRQRVLIGLAGSNRFIKTAEDCEGATNTGGSSQCTLPIRLFKPEDGAEAGGAAVADIEVGPCNFSDEGIGLVFTTPRWESENSDEDSTGTASKGRALLDLVVTGTSIGGMLNVSSRFSFAFNQALTRATFTNMVPDVVVTGRELLRKGPGGMVAVGFWGNSWEWRSDTTSCECP